MQIDCHKEKEQNEDDYNLEITTHMDLGTSNEFMYYA